MTSVYVKQLFHMSQLCLGEMMALCRLHHICYDDRAGDIIVVKSRRPGSRIAIRMGNYFLQYQKCDVEILATDKWIRWENAVQNEMKQSDSGETAELYKGRPQAFNRRHISGSSLWDLLKKGRYSDDQKFSAVRWAFDSLGRLHRRQADWGSGIIQSVSHGDATAHNVIVNLDLQEANWIDFDIRHLPHLSDLDRRADDLRALAFSAAVGLPVSKFPPLAETVIASIHDRRLLNRFRERLTNDWCQLNTFQLAQAPLSWNSKNMLRELLLKAKDHTDAR